MFCATGWKSEISRRQGAKGVSLPASELVPFQNYAGLRGWTRTGRPYPTFHGIHKPSTCGFDFTDYAMLGGSRPSLVNRHGFEIAGWAGARLVPIMGPAPAGWPLGGWRPAPRKRKRRSAGLEMPQGRRRGGGRPRRRPRGREGASRDFEARSRARVRRKFFRNCPCIGGGVPV